MISVSACGQISKAIVKANAYYTVPVPGTIMVDENGKEMPPPRTKIYTVYFEIKGVVPQWTRAWIAGKSFTPVTGQTSNDSIIVGKKYGNDGEIVLRTSKHTALFQIGLTPDEPAKQSPQKLDANKLFLEGKLKGKRFLYKISNFIQLASPEYP